MKLLRYLMPTTQASFMPLGFLSLLAGGKVHADTSVGSQIVGDSVNILSTNDTNISGSTVFGTNGVLIDSEKGDVNIVAAKDKFNETHFSKVTKSGFGALGGFSYGKMSNEQGMKGASTGHTGSTVASLMGDVDISAGKGKVNMAGSDVNSALGDVNIKAQNIAITDVHDTATQDTYTKFKSTGLSVSVSSPIIDAAKMGSTLADQAGKAEGGTQIGAVAASSALAGYVAFREISNVTDNLSGLASGASPTDILKAVGSLSISLGTQKSESKSHSEQSTSSGSSITAGGQVNLTATGKGKADDTLENNQGSDILVQGSTIAGKGGTHLKADDDIIALAGVNTDSNTSSNKSSGASVGVSVGASGVTVNLSVNMAKGKTNGNGTDYTETTIGDMGSQTTFESGDDTTLSGAAIVGKGVKGTVGGDLAITTLQDRSKYESKQTSASAGVSVPIGVSMVGVSGGYSNEKIKANHVTANEVSGIYAGEDGFDVDVKGQTSLTGAVIASGATADKNKLTTGTLITRDLENHSDYKATSVGVSATYNIGTEGQPNSLNPNLPSIMQAKDDENSTTRAGITAGTVTIRDEAGQQAATGQTAEQTVANLNRDVTLDMQNATGLENLYERDKDKIATGFEIVKTLSENTQKFMAIMAKDLDAAADKPAVGTDKNPITVKVFDKDGNEIGERQLTNKEAYEKGYELADTTLYAMSEPDKNGVRHTLKDSNGNPIIAQTLNYGTRQDLWGSGGTGSMILTGLVGAASGNVTGSGASLLQNTAINVIRQYGATEIKDIADGFMEDGKPTAQSETIRGLLHSIAGCAGAAATGGDCASAAAGSAATVALNNLIAADTKNMTAEQKQSYSNLITSLVGGVTVAAGGDAAAAALASKIEVDNNYLLTDNGDTQRFIDKLKDCQRIARSGNDNSDCMKKLDKTYQDVSNRNNVRMVQACKDNPKGTLCTTAIKEASDYAAALDAAGLRNYGTSSRNALVNAQYSFAKQDSLTQTLARAFNIKEALDQKTPQDAIKVVASKNEAKEIEAHKKLQTAISNTIDAESGFVRVYNNNGFNFSNSSMAVDEEIMAAREAAIRSTTDKNNSVSVDMGKLTQYYGSGLEGSPYGGIGIVFYATDSKGNPVMPMIVTDIAPDGTGIARPKTTADDYFFKEDAKGFNTAVGLINGVAGTVSTTMANGGVKNNYTNGTKPVQGTVNGEPAVVGTQTAGSIRNINPNYPNSGYNQNCVNCVVATDATLSGNPASALPSARPLPLKLLEQHYGNSFSSPMSITEIQQSLITSNFGSRGIVFGSVGPGRPGHVFNVVNQNGTVRFLDGQTGRPADLSGYKTFQLLRTN